MTKRRDRSGRSSVTVKKKKTQETQRRYRAIDALRLHTTVGLVNLEAADIVRCRRIGWALEERDEASHGTHIVTLCVVVQAAHDHVFEHALPQRADGL